MYEQTALIINFFTCFLNTIILFFGSYNLYTNYRSINLGLEDRNYIVSIYILFTLSSTISCFSMYIVKPIKYLHFVVILPLLLFGMYHLNKCTDVCEMYYRNNYNLVYTGYIFDIIIMSYNIFVFIPIILIDYLIYKKNKKIIFINEIENENNNQNEININNNENNNDEVSNIYPKIEENYYREDNPDDNLNNNNEEKPLLKARIVYF